jgi:hypothetical protein
VPAEARTCVLSVNTSNVTPRLIVISLPCNKRNAGAAGQNATATPAVMMPVRSVWLSPDFFSKE